MFINESQGQSLSYIGLHLASLVFNHGQLYVAIYEVRKRSSLKIFILDKKENPTSSTVNVAYKEIFKNARYIRYAKFKLYFISFNKIH